MKIKNYIKTKCGIEKYDLLETESNKNFIKKLICMSVYYFQIKRKNEQFPIILHKIIF